MKFGLDHRNHHIEQGKLCFSARHQDLYQLSPSNFFQGRKLISNGGNIVLASMDVVEHLPLYTSL